MLFSAVTATFIALIGLYPSVHLTLQHIILFALLHFRLPLAATENGLTTLSSHSMEFMATALKEAGTTWIPHVIFRWLFSVFLGIQVPDTEAIRGIFVRHGLQHNLSG